MPCISTNLFQRRNRYLIAILLLLNSFFSLKSQGQQKISFGKVSTEELQMTSYEGDSTAGAVILSDIGRFNGTELRFTRHIRVKILKKSGLDWGNWVFNTPTRGDFKVHVFNLVDGQVVRDKVDGSSIYREEIIQGYERYKVFAPNVRVGSIIDISYAFYGVPFEWRFQERIPIQYSELTLEQSLYIKYSKTFFGFEKVEPLSTYKWCARSMPAFKMEPFLNDYSNYITKFEFQLESIGMPGRTSYLAYSTSWEKINENLMSTSTFGGVLTGCGFLNDFVKETKSKNLTVAEKIDAAFAYVQQNIKWNGSKTLFATADLRANFLTNHTGNSAEINLVLITLLNKLDINTYPVVLSTRDNGLIQTHEPTFNKLNYVIGYIQHEGVNMFLDATSENLIHGNLPTYCLNGAGLVVSKKTTWLSLNEKYTDTKKQFVTIEISKEGSAVAKVNQEMLGIGFLNWAEEQKSQNYDAEIQKNKLQEDYPDFEILSYEVTKKDIKTSSAKEAIQVDVSSQLVDAGDEIIFNPFVMYEYAKNPFKSEERKYPVDLTCAMDLSTTISVQIPKEFSVKSVPESIRFSIPDGSASFTYLASASATGLQFRAVLKLQKYVYTETEYLELRQFFSEVLKKINSPVALVKN
jgi:hypothetical protein